MAEATPVEAGEEAEEKDTIVIVDAVNEAKLVDDLDDELADGLTSVGSPLITKTPFLPVQH